MRWAAGFLRPVPPTIGSRNPSSTNPGRASGARIRPETLGPEAFEPLPPAPPETRPDALGRASGVRPARHRSRGRHTLQRPSHPSSPRRQRARSAPRQWAEACGARMRPRHSPHVPRAVSGLAAMSHGSARAARWRSERQGGRRPPRRGARSD